MFVILVVAVTALAAMCYSYKLQLDSTREQLNKMAGNNTEETTAIVEDITSEITTQATTVATTEAVTESATTAVVSSGNNNTQAAVSYTHLDVYKRQNKCYFFRCIC